MFQGSVKNISLGGIQLSTREEFPAGSEIVLSFSLPNGEKLGEIEARVVRTQQLVDDRGKSYFKLGVQFTKCAEEDREKIARVTHVPS
jgi:c-di-GMP-binding flagellar brake protein YcgR